MESLDAYLPANRAALTTGGSYVLLQSKFNGDAEFVKQAAAQDLQG